MPKRKIIEIDREKCNGCGLCTKACAEGALVLDEHKKAVLAKEIYCDGMGACLDVCPVGALKIIEKESEDYDPQAAFQHVMKTQGFEAAKKVHGVPKFHGHAPAFGGCPGSMAREIKRGALDQKENHAVSGASELSQWPIQLHLISPHAPYFKDCDLLIAADCTAFTIGSFHQDLLKGKKLVIACPKLDDTGGYVEKIAELLKSNTVYSLTVVIMEVPCCSGLFRMVQEAVELSGTRLPIKKIVIGLDGSIRN
ncbi:MAG TPA: 4Fe-4S dicluster domain-containing protein [Candidatus Omnitrophota bacterium]|nr:4Fe-4S dicluster domain-containing protein [Candidatus Omnitrophota bacterium]HRY85981.1 4Fe-4S dicluster domain-containing protein [Candidatus Omnitrophota bacterium]